MSMRTHARAPQAASTPLIEVVVTEELTTPAAARLHTLLGDALALRPAQLVVDLTRCPRADALAVDILLNAHRRAIRMGSRLTLRAPNDRLRRGLALAHLDRVFDITTTPAAQPPPHGGGDDQPDPT